MCSERVWCLCMVLGRGVDVWCLGVVICCGDDYSTMEDGSRFGHFWWFYARVYYVYILVDQPYSDRNLMV